MTFYCMRMCALYRPHPTTLWPDFSTLSESRRCSRCPTYQTNLPPRVAGALVCLCACAHLLSCPLGWIHCMSHACSDRLRGGVDDRTHEIQTRRGTFRCPVQHGTIRKTHTSTARLRRPAATNERPGPPRTWRRRQLAAQTSRTALRVGPRRPANAKREACLIPPPPTTQAAVER